MQSIDKSQLSADLKHIDKFKDGPDNISTNPKLG